MKTAALLAALILLLPQAAPAGSSTSVVGAAGDTYTLKLTSLKEARFRNTIRQKYDFSCGSAAVATLLTYQYDYPVNEQTAFEQMYANGDKEKIHKEGFSLLDIKRYLAENGFDADGFRVPLEKLEEANLPAIALIDVKGYHHFVVIKGVRDGRVLVGDPALGTRAIPIDKFKTTWKSGLVFVIHNRRNLAVFNSPNDWRVAPSAPLGSAIDRNGLYNMNMPKRGPGDI